MKSKLCFVIMGFGQKQDPVSGKTIDLDETYLNIIRPAAEKAGYRCVRSDETQESGIIDKSMYGLLVHADLVIADITTYNPNAMYELGVRHTARPYSTIVMLKSQEAPIPFDLKSNKIFFYEHFGSYISASEARKSTDKLETLIRAVEKTKSVDSPPFTFLQLKEHSLCEEDYVGIIEELSQKEKYVFAIVEKAKLAMKSGDMKAAAEWWGKAAKKVHNEVYYAQQYALCTYKSKFPSESAALLEGLSIITQLEASDQPTMDTETLGIKGAIYKRLWLKDENIEFLDLAIDCYKKGFTINNDYYTGENYALCIEMKARMVSDKNERIYYLFEAEKTRDTIREILEIKLNEEGIDEHEKKIWMHATLAACYYSVDELEKAKEQEREFKEMVTEPWQEETYLNSKQLLRELKKLN